MQARFGGLEASNRNMYEFNFVYAFSPLVWILGDMNTEHR